MKDYIEYKRETAESVDLTLRLKLSSGEYRTLSTLVRSNGPWSMKGITSMESVIHIAKHQSKPLATAKKIVALYRLADISETDWHKHWEVMRYDQAKINQEYKSMARPPRQDNKTYLNKQKTWGASNRNMIRYPRKKRKTAWKRFYKLFPHLNPENKS
jgi:hypothetical protein